jgi:hypothetical protein
MAILKQNQFEFDEQTVVNTVMMDTANCGKWLKKGKYLCTG